jgi:hypothetical protein
MLPFGEQPEAAAMAEALRRLPDQRRPSEVVVPGLLDGLETVDRLVQLAASRAVPEPARWLA